MKRVKIGNFEFSLKAFDWVLVGLMILGGGLILWGLLESRGRSEEEVGKLVEKEIARVYGALEKYCELDTMAEVRIVEGLWEILKGEEDK